MCQFLSTVFICEHSRKMPTSVLTIHIYMYIFHKKWLSQEFCAFSPSLRTAKDPFVRHRCHRRPINPKPKHHQENGAFQQSAQRENIQHISTHTKVVPHSWACFRSSLNQKDLKRYLCNSKGLEETTTGPFHLVRHHFATAISQQSMGMNQVGQQSMGVSKGYDGDGLPHPSLYIYIYMYTGWWYSYPSEKWWSESQLGWWHSQYDGKVIKAMFQTTNQCIYI